MKALRKNQSGFTLAELLIIVAIIAVLITVAVPMFGSQRERANIAVDQATMRTAYSLLIAQSLTGDIQADGTPYFYDAAAQTFVTDRPAGYGKSKTDASLWWSGLGTASGAPNNGTPTPLMLTLYSDGTVDYCWGSNTYTGLKVSSKDYGDIKASSAKIVETQNNRQVSFVADFVERDKVLLDSLQTKLQSMTYGELHNMFFDETGALRESFSGEAQTDNRNQPLTVNQGNLGGMCVTLAESTIVGNAISTDEIKHNQVLATDLFAAVGYDISTNSAENYLITSVSDKTNARIWACLGISMDKLKKMNPSSPDWNTPAAKAYTYIKGSGAPTANVLRQETRQIK